MVNWDWCQGDKLEGKFKFMDGHWNEDKKKSMLFRMIMCQLQVSILPVGLLPVAIPPVGLMPVVLLPIVTDQDMFFEQGDRLVTIKVQLFWRLPYET